MSPWVEERANERFPLGSAGCSILHIGGTVGNDGAWQAKISSGAAHNMHPLTEQRADNGVHSGVLNQLNQPS